VTVTNISPQLKQSNEVKDMDNHVNTSAKKSSMGNFVFLIISFPLGLFYFLITVIGFSLGMGTLVIWVGLPILFITLLCIRGMADVERRVVSNLLRMPMRYQLPGQREPARGFLRRFGRILKDPYTWTSMIYMLLKLPLGIISFTLAITLSVLSFATTLLPLAYLINLFVNTILLKNGIQSDGILIPYFIEVHATFDPTMFARSFIGVPIGIVLWIVTRFVLNGLALFSGELAKALLGPGETIVVQPHQDLRYGYTSPMIMQEQQANLD
jgi:hypothetical protein